MKSIRLEGGGKPYVGEFALRPEPLGDARKNPVEG